MAKKPAKFTAEPTLQQEAGLPDNWIPVDSTPIEPGKSAPGIHPPNMAPYFSGSIPPPMQLQPDTVRTQYDGSSTPSARLMPVGASGNPSIVSAAQSVAQQVVNNTVGNLGLQMPKEYAVATTKGFSVVTWVDEASGTALMAPADVLTTTPLVVYFNYNATFTSGAAASGALVLNPTLTAWSSNHTFVTGAVIVDSNGNVQRATTGGVTAIGSHPTWATVVGTTTLDGTVTWTCVKYQISAGDTIIAVVELNPNPNPGPNNVTTVTDTAGNVWSAASPVQTFLNAGSQNESMQVWTAVANSNIAYGSPLTVTFNFNGSTAPAIYASTYSNLGARTHIASAAGTGTSWSSGSVTIGATEIMFSFSAATDTETVTAPFVIVNGVSGGNNVQYASYNPAAAGTYSDAWTAGFSTNWCSSLLSFAYGVQVIPSTPPGIPGFRAIVNTDLKNAIFGASGAFHEPGAVPDPGVVPGSTRFLNENATWLTAVSSIGLTVPSFLSVSPATITTTGTFAITLATQSANTGFFGPTTGAAAAPTFRALVVADLPSGTASTSTIQTWTAAQTFHSGDFILGGATSGTLVVKPAAVAGSNTLTLPAGTTDFSATGGTHQFVKQTGAGAALTVAAIVAADMPLNIDNGGGVLIGAPTGGAQGAGTLNVATGIYLNASAYTNPDYVFEKHFTGKIEKFLDKRGAKEYSPMSLEDLEEYARVNFQLPRVATSKELFSRTDILLEKVEELYIHLFDLNKRIKKQEQR